MRLTESLARQKVETQEQLVRTIVREEIERALSLLASTADREDVPYETGELESSALGAIGKVAERAVQRLRDPEDPYNAPVDELCPTCGHFTRGHAYKKSSWGNGACYGCGGCSEKRVSDAPDPFEEETRG